VKRQPLAGGWALANGWLIVVLGGGLGALLLTVAWWLTSRHLAVTTGIEALIGQVGIAESELAPEGTIKLDSEQWSARAESGPIKPGDPVRVVGVHGVTLRVIRAEPA
jgi:membrane-bound serine protease (ClpP class)